MSFILDNITSLRSQDKAERVQGVWAYRTTDTKAAILTADYFLEGYSLIPDTDTATKISTYAQRSVDMFYEGDQILVERVDSSDNFIEAFTVYVSSVTKTGTATITVDILYEAVEKLTVLVPDISTNGSSAFIASPYKGTVVSIQSTLQGAITVGDAVLTCSIDGAAITGGTITIAHSASAAGDVDTATPTAANSVDVGEVLSVASNGGSTDAAAAYVTFFIRR